MYEVKESKENRERNLKTYQRKWCKSTNVEDRQKEGKTGANIFGPAVLV